MSNKKRIVLHGYLKDLLPSEIYLSADTVAEAINGICKQTDVLNPTPGQERHQIRAVGFDTVESLFEPTTLEEIHLVPDLSGGKSGGIFKVALGVVLVGAAIMLSGPAGLATTFSVFGASISTGSVALFGAMMALGGLMEMMSPSPKMDLDGEGNVEGSKYLGTPKNTVKIGTRIPILYGRHKCYGHYISFNIDAKDVGSEDGENNQLTKVDVEPPANLTVVDSSFQGQEHRGDDILFQYNVTLDWTKSPDDKLDYYEVTASRGAGDNVVNNVFIEQTEDTAIEVNDIEPGNYTFSVVAVNTDGYYSAPATKRHTIGPRNTDR